MIPLFKPYMPENLPELNHVLNSGQLAYGHFAKQFEKLLAQYIGIERILVTNTFNAANLVAINALGLKPGDEVIASPMCCLASTQPLAASYLKVKWVDIDPTTGTLDPDSVTKAITPCTKAIFHNHFGGYAGYVNEISAIAREKGILLIDDISEAFGTEYEGKKAGNWEADATVYSFQTVRLPNTIDGGAISFKSTEHLERAILARDYGIDRTRFRDDLNEIWSGCDIDSIGFGATPSDVNCYIGSKQIPELDNLIDRQRHNLQKWPDLIPPSWGNPIQQVKGSIPNGWLFGFLAHNKRSFIEWWRNNGQYYASGVHLPNCHYSLFGSQGTFPGIMEFSSKFIALPSGWWVNL